jgi:hypothetical protein
VTISKSSVVVRSVKEANIVYSLSGRIIDIKAGVSDRKWCEIQLNYHIKSVPSGKYMGRINALLIPT